MTWFEKEQTGKWSSWLCCVWCWKCSEIA